MPVTYGVIDLGTNTFHLLIALPLSGGKWEVVYRERRFVKLAADGIAAIGPAPYARGLEAMQHFAEKLKAHDVQHFRAIGTAALRRAENGAQFIQEVKAQTGIDIELIDGAEEARLIARGVQQTLVSTTTEPLLIMDVGGGSVEFILFVAGQTVFARSFPVGVAILRDRFHRAEPISEEELRQLRAFLQESLLPLAKVLQAYPSIQLVGAAGIFEVLTQVLGGGEEKSLEQLATPIDLAAFQHYRQSVLPLSLAERLAAPTVPSDRADMMVVALELLQFVLELTKTDQLLASAYALKEGALLEMAEGSDSSVA